jgi:cell division protease FtsH
MNKIIGRVGLYIVIILLVLGIVQYISNQGEESQIITYDKFLVEFKKENVKDLTLKVQGLTYLINGELKKEKKPFVSTAPFDASFVKLISESDVKQTWKKQEGPSIWVTLLTSIIPFIIIFFLFFFLLNQAQGGGGKVMNFGKSRARLYNDDKKRVTFEDVAGADEEKQELIE